MAIPVRAARLRGQVFGAIVVILLQAGIGMFVNLFVSIPKHHPGADSSDYFSGSTRSVSWAIAHGGVVLAIHVALGLLLALMVIGIVAKNGILLLDADQRFRAEGVGAEESMIRAGERRLRPIMMTALATVAGMLPLAFAFGAGSQMLQPLAIAVIGGIAASMVLSLVVTPAVRYYLGGRNE